MKWEDNTDDQRGNCYNMLLVRSMIEDRKEGSSAVSEEVGGSLFE